MTEQDRNPAADAEVYDPAPVVRDAHTESTITRIIEQQTARVPSHWFLVASMGAMGASVAFELLDNQRLSRFVGMWAPTLLIMGVYNKLVKSLGPR